MKVQTVQEMRELRATEEEIQNALELLKVLRPSIRVKRENGRIETTQGDKTLLGLLRTVKDIVNRRTPGVHEDDFTRINNDVNGNPRYVIHFLNCLPERWKEDTTLTDRYNAAIRLMNKIGGRKFHNKQYGGGIVFQSYSPGELIKNIEELKGKVE